MNFSADDFDRNAKALVSALESTETNDDGAVRAFENDANPFALTDWQLCHDDNGWDAVSYLTHPPVILSTRASPLTEQKDAIHPATVQASNGGDDNDNDNDNDDDDNLEDNLEEEDIIVDDECYVDETILNENAKDYEQFRVDTQWTFTVVYSSTYQAPVLYFRVQDTNGNPIGRRQLLQLLHHAHQRSTYTASNDFPTDAWEFVSQEENPVTGLPSFFLHPCQSAQRLQSLAQAASTSSAAAKPEPTSTVDAGFAENSVLWSWMSMILPAVGHSIPPIYFRRIQNRIACFP